MVFEPFAEVREPRLFPVPDALPDPEAAASSPVVAEAAAVPLAEACADSVMVARALPVSEGVADSSRDVADSAMENRC